VGMTYHEAKDTPGYVRCVSASPSGVNRFSRTEPDPTGHAGQMVVTDSISGLMWQGCAAGRTSSACTGTPDEFNWQQALDYCQDSDWAGFDDWYLPDSLELAGIIDERGFEPSIDQDYFPGTRYLPFQFWTSSTESSSGEMAWLLNFDRGDLNPDYKTSLAYFVRCVRQGS